MKSLFLSLLMLFVSFIPAKADDYCTAEAFLTDFRGDFASQRLAEAWCKGRFDDWGLKGKWQDSCRFERRDLGYGKFQWRAQFWHSFKKYNTQYPSGLWSSFDRDFSYRLFKGKPGKIQFHFGDRCGY